MTRPGYTIPEISRMINVPKSTLRDVIRDNRIAPMYDPTNGETGPGKGKGKRYDIGAIRRALKYKEPIGRPRELAKVGL